MNIKFITVWLPRSNIVVHCYSITYKIDKLSKNFGIKLNRISYFTVSWNSWSININIIKKKVTKT